MDDFALILTPADGARRANRLHTDNTDKNATIRAGTGFKLWPDAGTIRIVRKIKRQNRTPRNQRLRHESWSEKWD